MRRTRASLAYNVRQLYRRRRKLTQKVAPAAHLRNSTPEGLWLLIRRQHPALPKLQVGPHHFRGIVLLGQVRLVAAFNARARPCSDSYKDSSVYNLDRRMNATGVQASRSLYKMGLYVLHATSHPPQLKQRAGTWPCSGIVIYFIMGILVQPHSTAAHSRPYS